MKDYPGRTIAGVFTHVDNVHTPAMRVVGSERFPSGE
jgi:hypothetical protein